MDDNLDDFVIVKRAGENEEGALAAIPTAVRQPAYNLTSPGRVDAARAGADVGGLGSTPAINTRSSLVNRPATSLNVDFPKGQSLEEAAEAFPHKLIRLPYQTQHRATTR